MAFTKQDLRTIHASLTRLLPPAPSLPRTAEEVVEIGRVRDLVAVAIRELAPNLERGALVLTWRVPRVLAPRMNELAFWKPFMRIKAKKAHDDALKELLAANPAAQLHGAELRRWLRVTRFSPKQPDEVSVDAIGGKMPVDALVRHGVLHDDDQRFTHREAIWQTTKPGNTHLLVEVFEMRVEGVAADGPKEEQIAQAKRVDGAFTRSLKGT